MSKNVTNKLITILISCKEVFYFFGMDFKKAAVCRDLGSIIC